ncbi:RnfH family protein [Legionella jordanis]|uniref:UPF0125 protein Ljor_1901 n=1 Tax=Legionella jordanis TaxID=456 RepID=A0A0W0VBT3_9GAMM|nr:RnfH family protein [Legionella jordanis]KTD17595.1 Persistence and stress-resistance antitoxin PasI [Legionella jordanis]RMX00878.1 RnfH family protein [Legionella jordanis]RMX17911.1 RnfH family protein [Legionella jordanis]VEH11483.1 protein yfjF [Legionella jordanis]HAT8714899.1 RnfH family protein [Legionella jordanis]
MVKVEIVYIKADGNTIHHRLELKSGSTILDALDEVKLWQNHPETKSFSTGIFSKVLPLDTVLKSGDRIEIYRPLTLDPKEKRRQRAKNQ